MQETNYCAHAVDGLKRVLGYDIPEHLRVVADHLVAKIPNAVHFRLPDNGKIFDVRNGEKIKDILQKYCPEGRLPYPCVTLEYSFDVSECEGPRDDLSLSLASVIVAQELDIDGARWIAVTPLSYSVFANGQKQWQPTALGAKIEALTGDIQYFGQHRPYEDEIADKGDVVVKELLMCVTTLAQFMAALSCSNSTAADATPPNPALNAKRRKAGKTPFFSYKVLTITTNGSASSKGDQGGTHGSPRVHLRRGHIRRLPERTVWVNACVVGDKSKGLVHKDYKVV